MEIIWTKLAKITYQEILENLDRRWTKKEIKSFNKLTVDLLEKVKNKEVVHPYIHHKLTIRKGIIHKNVSLFYREDSVNHRIYLITFFNNRMNPEILKELLLQVVLCKKRQTSNPVIFRSKIISRFIFYSVFLHS